MNKVDATELHKKINLALNDMGLLVEGRAKIRCPVKSGRLRNSITYAVDGNKVEIGTIGVDYASFVEYGTKSMVNAHGEHDPLNPVTDWEALRERGGSRQTMPFLRTAAFESENDFKKILRKYFE